MMFQSQCIGSPINWSCATSEEGKEPAKGIDNDGPRVPIPGEWTDVIVMGVDCCFHQIMAAKGRVVANMRLKSIQTTNCGEHGRAAFYNISHMLVVVVSVIWHAYLFGGENASELEEMFGWIIEI